MALHFLQWNYFIQDCSYEKYIRWNKQQIYQSSAHALAILYYMFDKYNILKEDDIYVDYSAQWTKKWKKIVQ